ncbi:MAG: LD-carboxypeptidase [Bradymonadaceae bacterium]
MTLLHPPKLRPGDRVAVVSPAGPVTPELLEPGLEQLRTWGLDVDLRGPVYGEAPERGYLAASDDRRLESLREVVLDDSVDAVIFSRGGYGTMRLFPELARIPFRESPTLLIGFSDLTALHLHVAGQREVATLHGPVVKSLRLHDRDGRTTAQLRAALFGDRDQPFALDGLEPIRPGQASGPLLGGNLSLLAHLLDTPYCPDLSGSVLLIEETGEEDYRLDRLFTALRLSDSAGDPAAVVLGDFTDCGGAYVDSDGIAAYVRDLAGEFDCPVVADLPVGHGSRNVPLPMGAEVRVDADAGRAVFAADAVDG